MRIVIASVVLSAALPILHAQAIGVVMGSTSSGSGRGNALHQTNNPFTLVLEQKTVQTLPDGTHITRTDHETLLRDTLGRTRAEHASEGMAGMSLHTVTVDDTVAGRVFNWAESAGGMSREYSVRDEHPSPSANQVRPVVTRQATTTIAQDRGQYHMVQEPKTPLPRPQIHEEDLGMKDIQGASCKAARTTTVFPEGFFGNDRPITETNEHCFSQEFFRDIERTRVDPRSGTTTTTVLTLNRGEPDASLFRPPSDYKERPQAQPLR